MVILFKVLSYVNKKINPFLRIASVVIVSVMCTATVIGVVSRYIMRSPFGWTEALARYSMIIMGFFGIK